MNNIPGFKEKREALLPLAHKIANFSDEQKKEMEAPQFLYSTGWSHGKEKFEGKPDLLKGSYYANPCYDSWQNPKDEKGHRDTITNIWPNKNLPELELRFKELG